MSETADILPYTLSINSPLIASKILNQHKLKKTTEFVQCYYFKYWEEFTNLIFHGAKKNLLDK